MDKKYAAQEAITHSMMGSLGLKLIEEKEGFIRASMPVNDNTSQPFGVLCGGASLAFAEIIAGYGSYLCCPEGFIPVGSSVSGNHVSSVAQGAGCFGLRGSHGFTSRPHDASMEC